jgi:hypothetical protein
VIRATVVFSLLALALSPPTQAAIIDLTAQTSGTIDLTSRTDIGVGRLVHAKNGGDFIVTPVSTGLATGTGVFKPFVRIERKDNEHGYNTSNRNPGLYFDEKTDPNWTHALKLADIPLVTFNNEEYRVFNLDVNEPDAAKKATLSINQIQIFVGAGDPKAYTSLTPPFSSPYLPYVPPMISFVNQGLQEVFRMNDSSAAFNQIKLDYDLISSGSGRNDMTLLVKNSVFGPGNPNVVLYSHFGKPPGTYASESGFEEWAVDTNGGGANPPPAPPVRPVPEPTTLAIWGLGLGIAGLVKLRRNKLAA